MCGLLSHCSLHHKKAVCLRPASVFRHRFWTSQPLRFDSVPRSRNQGSVVAETDAEGQAAERTRKLSSCTKQRHEMTQLTLIVSAAHRAILVVSVYIVPSANVYVLVELLHLSIAYT